MDFTFAEKVLLLVALENKMDACAEMIKEIPNSSFWKIHLRDYTSLRVKILQSE